MTIVLVSWVVQQLGGLSELVSAWSPAHGYSKTANPNADGDPFPSPPPR